MGHRISGILYGCMTPSDLDRRAEDGILPKWEKTKANRKLGVTACEDGDKPLLGFWVAVAGEMKDIRDISKIFLPLTIIEQTAGAKFARNAWTRFVWFSKEHGVHIPTATFWL